MLYFKKEDRLVKNYVLLILSGVMLPEDVPNLFNLRQAVADALGLETLDQEVVA